MKLDLRFLALFVQTFVGIVLLVFWKVGWNPAFFTPAKTVHTIIGATLLGLLVAAGDKFVNLDRE